MECIDETDSRTSNGCIRWGYRLCKSIKKVWPKAKHQRCIFHVFCQVKRYTTSRPNTMAGIELYSLAKALLVIRNKQERDNWKSKFQKKKKEYEDTKSELAEVQKDYQKLSGEKEILHGLADRYNRLLRMLGKDMVERLVQDDIRMQAELEAKKQMEL